MNCDRCKDLEANLNLALADVKRLSSALDSEFARAEYYKACYLGLEKFIRGDIE